MGSPAGGALRNYLRRGRPARPGYVPIASTWPPVAPALSSSERLVLSLPVPPSINHQYATVNGRRVLSAVGRRYKAFVAQQILVLLARLPQREALLRSLHAHYLALSIDFHFRSPLRRDVDSGLKITQDALCEALGINDNRVVEIHLHKVLGVKHPCIEVSLCPSATYQASILPRPKRTAPSRG